MNFTYSHGHRSKEEREVLNYEEIESIIKEWKRHAGIDEDEKVSYYIIDGILYLMTDKPGYMIGQRGYLIKGYAEILKEYNITRVDIFESKKFQVI